MRPVIWLFRALLFLLLFAFALNNQQPATVHWLFGIEWQAPMVIIVLAAFAAGCAMGVAAMLPSWWRQRRLAQRMGDAPPPAPRASAAPAPHAAPSSEFGAEALTAHPPRDGV